LQGWVKRSDIHQAIVKMMDIAALNPSFSVMNYGNINNGSVCSVSAVLAYAGAVTIESFIIHYTAAVIDRTTSQSTQPVSWQTAGYPA